MLFTRRLRHALFTNLFHDRIYCSSSYCTLPLKFKHGTKSNSDWKLHEIKGYQAVEKLRVAFRKL